MERLSANSFNLDSLKQLIPNLEDLKPDNLGDVTDMARSMAGQYADRFMRSLTDAEDWMREQLADQGFSHGAQTALMLAATALLFVFVLRKLRGWLRIPLVVVLVAFAVKLVMPPGHY